MESKSVKTKKFSHLIKVNKLVSIIPDCDSYW